MTEHGRERELAANQVRVLALRVACVLAASGLPLRAFCVALLRPASVSPLATCPELFCVVHDQHFGEVELIKRVPRDGTVSCTAGGALLFSLLLML